MNKAEEFVSNLCGKSFLSLWSYENPQGKDPRKELCDLLVICEPDIIIFSVKDIKASNSGDMSLDWSRWRKKAIKDSCKQIYGAERWIKSATHVIRKDGLPGLPFPRPSECRVHRIAVALGGQGQVPISFGDFGKGFIHVFDERSFAIVLQELNTISDFVKYLVDKEALYKAGVKTVFEGGEEDLLAVYLHAGRKFPLGHDVIVIEDCHWSDVSEKPEYKAKLLLDKESYVWDRLIETFCDDILHGTLEFGNSLAESELVVRTMARESRFYRRILGKTFLEFLKNSKGTRARIVPSPSEVTYMFLNCPHGEDRQYRVAELGNRCFIARGIYKNNKTVIGIATEQYEPGKGFSLDAVYLHFDNWSERERAHSEAMQKDLGFFVKPVETRIHEDEYPVG